VRFDEFRGAFEACQYLIELGHRDIWYIGDVSLPWYKTRYEAYAAAMAAAGLEARGQTVRLAENLFANGYASTDMILSKGMPVSAIFAGADNLAYGVLEALNHRRLSVPRDISLIAFDDLPDSEFKSPPLTTVHVDRIEVGRQLARLAIEKAKNPNAQLPEVVLPAGLIRRGTTWPLVQQQAATAL
jgi:LacI family transcriptional regulator